MQDALMETLLTMLVVSDQIFEFEENLIHTDNELYSPVNRESRKQLQKA